MKYKTEEEKLAYLKKCDEENRFIPEEEREEFRQLVEEGCEKYVLAED